MNLDETKGLIFDIQGHSVHDGPGSRTLVFLSGCPLRCTWCSNPEGGLFRRRLMYRVRLCQNCPARCATVCPKGAVTVNGDGSPPVLFDRKQCDVCDSFECVQHCYTQSLKISGRWYTITELMRVLGRDRDYWGRGGGVSFSGGEPLLQQRFISAALRKCHDAYIHCAVETTGYVDRAFVFEVLPYISWMFLDLKHMDSALHKEATGVGNELILSNIRAVASSGWRGRLIIRCPVVPGFNDTVENARAAAEFLKSSGLSEINILPFHRLGTSKYEQLGCQYAHAEQEPPAPELIEGLRQTYEAAGVRCYVGSDTPF